jgi:predicted nucleotidyltransferase component of viral defense system
MQALAKQEQFELEVLDKLNSAKLLNQLVFLGGTMLRLCFGLNRFSVDLDFWITKKLDTNKLFKDIEKCLDHSYMVIDAANKFNTLLFEIKSNNYPRSLKLEIRKGKKRIKTEPAIAYSKFSNLQVLLNVVSLSEMMQAKIDAFLNRKEIRDIFDIEFLLKKGVSLDAPKQMLKIVLNEIDGLTKDDYKVKLGSLLESEQRKYYITENFKILKSVIKEKLD